MAGNISTETTTLSNLTIDRNLSVGTILGSPAITGGAITGSTLSLTGAASLAAITGSTVSLTGTASLVAITGTSLVATAGVSAATVGATSGLSVGGGVLLTRIQKGTISVVTMTLTGPNSSTTTAAVSGLSTVDVLHVMPPTTSGLSADIVLQAWSSGSGIATLMFSNVSSAATVVQAGPVNYPYIAIRS